MAEWETAGWMEVPGEIHWVEAEESLTSFEDELMEAMTKPLDEETTVVSSWGGHKWSWSKSVAEVNDIVEERTGMAKKVSAHAKPEMVDGVWVCSVCNSESMDRQMFEEAGEWEECAKNYAAEATGEEKDALGRYVAGAEAKQNLDRATDAIKQFREGMKSLGLAAADMNLMMRAVTGELEGVTPEDVNRLAKKFPELKPTLDEVNFPEEVMEELKPLNQREWHKNLMKELNHHYSWGYADYTVVDRILDFGEDCIDFIVHDIFRKKW